MPLSVLFTISLLVILADIRPKVRMKRIGFSSYRAWLEFRASMTPEPRTRRSGKTGVMTLVPWKE